MANPNTNRETWLTEAADMILSSIIIMPEVTEYPTPTIKVSVGFPYRAHSAIGQCFVRNVNILLTKKQIADLYNVSPATLDKWVRDGLVMKPKRWYIEAMTHHFRKMTGMAPANDDKDDLYDQWGK